MIYLPYVTDADLLYARVWRDYQNALREAGDDLFDWLRARLTWQAWVGKFKSEHNEFWGSPLTQAMVDYAAANCPKPLNEMAIPHDPPLWANPKPGQACTCGYCTGRLPYKYEKHHYINRAQDAHIESGDE